MNPSRKFATMSAYTSATFDDKLPLTREELERSVQKQWIWRTAILAASILAVIIAVLAIVFGYWGWNGVANYNSPMIVRGSGFFPNSPNVFYIDSAGVAATLTLPSDLTNYVGNVYRVWSRTSQMHVVRLSAGTEFVGGSTIATLQGNIGDGFVFEVLSASRIIVWPSPINVVFT